MDNRPNNSPEWALEELRRKVDNQLETSRNYKSQAQGILRSFLTAIGIIITGLSISGNFPQIPNEPLGPEQLNNTQQSLINHFPVLETPFVQLVVGVIGISILLFTLLFLYYLLAALPYQIYQVLQPRGYLVAPCSTRSKTSNLQSQYEEVIDHNKELLEAEKSALNKCYTTILWIFLSAGAVVVLYLNSFLNTRPIYVIANFVLLLVLGASQIIQRVDINTFKEKFSIYPKLDIIGILVVVIYPLVTITSGVLDSIINFLTLILILAYFAIAIQVKDLDNILLRNMMVYLPLFILHVGLIIAFGIEAVPIVSVQFLAGLTWLIILLPIAGGVRVIISVAKGVRRKVY